MLLTVILVGTRTKHIPSHQRVLLISLQTKPNRLYLSSGPPKVTASQLCDKMTYFENSQSKTPALLLQAAVTIKILLTMADETLCPSLAFQLVTPGACLILSLEQTTYTLSETGQITAAGQASVFFG